MIIWMGKSPTNGEFTNVEHKIKLDNDRLYVDGNAYEIKEYVEIIIFAEGNVVPLKTGAAQQVQRPNLVVPRFSGN